MGHKLTPLRQYDSVLIREKNQQMEKQRASNLSSIHSSVKLPSVYERLRAQESTKSIFDFVVEKDTIKMDHVLSHEKEKVIETAPFKKSKNGSPILEQLEKNKEGHVFFGRDN